MSIGNFADLRARYRFTSNDEANLKSILPLASDSIEKFQREFYEEIANYKRVKEFFKTEASLENHNELIAQWFLKLFSGPFDSTYTKYLKSIAKTHVKNGVPIHYITDALNFVRDFCISMIDDNMESSVRSKLKRSANRIIDMNLGLLTSEHLDRLVEKQDFVKKMEGGVVQFSRRFTQILNIILIVSLVLISVGITADIIISLLKIKELGVQNGVMGAIGSILVLWVMIEITDTEISHLKGKRIPISAFIGVALVAFVRDALVSTMSIDKNYTTTVVTIFAILLLGITYWLVKKKEQ